MTGIRSSFYFASCRRGLLVRIYGWLTRFDTHDLKEIKGAPIYGWFTEGFDRLEAG